MVVYDYGTDLDSSLTFEDGDLKLISYEDNIVQAIRNRLNTIQDSMSLFYEDYGSYLRSYFSWKRKDRTLEYIKLEIDHTIAKDPRIDNFNTKIEFTDDGKVKVIIHLYYENKVLDLNYVFDENGVEVVD